MARPRKLIRHYWSKDIMRITGLTRQQLQTRILKGEIRLNDNEYDRRSADPRVWIADKFDAYWEAKQKEGKNDNTIHTITT